MEIPPPHSVWKISIFLGGGVLFRPRTTWDFLKFPDFQKLSKAYNFKYFELKDDSDLHLVEEIFAYPKALICNVFIDNDFRVTPQVKFGRPNEDMGPLLPREMFNANMIIDPIK